LRSSGETLVTTRLSTLSDAELVERCRAGDTEAWNELVERFARYVYAVAVRGFRLGEQDAEDVFQEVFTRIYTRLDSLRDGGALRPWIAQLTRRVCLDTLSRSGREQPAGDDETEETSDAMVDVEEAMAVREAMRSLPESCQEILDRFFAQDQSYRTISSELDLPAGTIASRIARCLRKLRGELEGRSELSPGSRK
jgi:RNA polymerase sigma factor (sigma-70 family)